MPLLYSFSEDSKSICCHLCGFRSFNPHDIEHLYCIHCDIFFGDLEGAASMCDQAFGWSNRPRTLQFFRDVGAKLSARGSSTNEG